MLNICLSFNTKNKVKNLIQEQVGVPDQPWSGTKKINLAVTFVHLFGALAFPFDLEFELETSETLFSGIKGVDLQSKS